jgi:aryl-alcohol dehydrogenase-like predicted oxidoreductase
MTMTYRRLGKTELSVSTVGIGTWQFAGVWGKHFEQPEVTDILSRARELGINFIDTAECYGFHHLSEQLIGTAIAGHREQWIIATKFGHNHANDLADGNYHPDQVLIQLEESLRALQTDYIDVYQLHSAADVLFDNDALWTMLDKQVLAGKVRFLGNSVGLPHMQYQVQKSQDYGVSVIQTIYNAVRKNAEETVFPVAAEQDLGVIARVPLCSGFLSGKYQPGHVFPGDDVRAMRPQQGIDREINAALAALQQRPANIAPVPWANAWCLKQPRVATVIPGIKSLAQLEANALAGSITL